VAHFFDDGPTAPNAPSPQRPVEFDALADLFLGEDDAPALRLTSEPSPPPIATAPAPAPPKAPSHAASGEHVVEALILGHLPVLAGAWAAQHARCLADESARPVALARFTSSTASLQLMGPRDALDDTEDSETLDDAAQRVASCAPAWCLRVEAPSELDLAASERVTRVTLLSGADEAAVVAAYRTLKGICELSADDAGPALAVRIMGADDETAAEAEEKIRRVAKAFLDRELEFLPPSKQIHAGTGRTLFRGDHETGYDEFLAGLPAGAPASEPSSPAIAEESADDTSLAERIGLAPLALRCPTAPTIEFARDDAGRLHLLGLGADSAEDLLAAEGWARTNATVVLAAAGLAPDTDLVVRVLTDTPARDRRLLDARFRVDLLREVRVGDDTAWCCVPLNTDD